MFAVATILIVAFVSLLISRIATLALVLTGMSQEAARFQARSALTGTGFTTSEAERVVNHPVRRRIVMVLMPLAGAGLITAIATLIIGFANVTRGQAFARLGILLAALTVLLLVSRTRAFNRAVRRLLRRRAAVRHQGRAGRHPAALRAAEPPRRARQPPGRWGRRPRPRRRGRRRGGLSRRRDHFVLYVDVLVPSASWAGQVAARVEGKASRCPTSSMRGSSQTRRDA